MTLNKLFVYGTLRPGEFRYDFIEPYVTDVQPAMMPQCSLYTVGSYPFIVKECNGDVVGEVLTIAPEHIDDVLRMLDDIEGYDPNSSFEQNLFSREMSITFPIDTDYRALTLGEWDDVRTKVWVYIGGAQYVHMSRAGFHKRIGSEEVPGDWKRRNE